MQLSSPRAWLGRSDNALAIVIAQAAGDAARRPILAARLVGWWFLEGLAVSETYFFSKHKLRTSTVQCHPAWPWSSLLYVQLFSHYFRDHPRSRKNKYFDPRNIVVLRFGNSVFWRTGRLNPMEIFCCRLCVTLRYPSEWVIDLVCIYIYIYIKNDIITYIQYMYIYIILSHQWLIQFSSSSNSVPETLKRKLPRSDRKNLLCQITSIT